jgi:hypothetical protein
VAPSVGVAHSVGTSEAEAEAEADEDGDVDSLVAGSTFKKPYSGMIWSYSINYGFISQLAMRSSGYFKNRRSLNASSIWYSYRKR